MNTNKLTPTCQDDETLAVDLVLALQGCWSAIRVRHPEIPRVFVVVASGSPARPTQPMKWGHFAALRWQHGESRLPEVFISGEGLSRTPAEVLTTLLHEAAHALNDSRGIQDTSRQGRWHNKHFAVAAKEMGLGPSKDRKLGWSSCTLPDATADIYRLELDILTDALRVYRHPEPEKAKGRRNSNNGLSCECACGRRIRVSRATFQTGSIVCALCDCPFIPDEPLVDESGDQT